MQEKLLEKPVYSQGLQNEIQKILTRTIFALIASTTVVTAGFEGYSSTIYKDSAGVPTICYGETNLSLLEGKKASREQCLSTLSARLQGFSNELVELGYDTPPAVLLGVLDFSYNIGSNAYKNSSVRRHLLNKDYKKAGESVLLWKYIHKDNTKMQDGTGEGLKERYRIDCSKSSLCKGLWDRRKWQAYSIGNFYKDLITACRASQRVDKQGLEVCDSVQEAIEGVLLALRVSNARD